jgi:hypothetical protein
MKRYRKTAGDVEADRLRALRAYSRNMRGTKKSPQADFGPGTYGCHEALHAAHMLAELVESALLDHPAIILNPRWYKRARRAVAELNQLYQDIGAAHLSRR